MSDAPWLDYLIKLEQQGFKEVPGPASNPKILEWSRTAAQHPWMQDDSTTPWCGIGMAGVFYDIGMKDAIPSEPAAAINWKNVGPACSPRIGAIAVFPRPGGNHVTCIRAIKGFIWECIGCNQNDAVTTSNFNAHQALGTYWPKGAPMTDTQVAAPETSRYKDLLQRCQVNPSWQSTIDNIANTIIKYKDQYKEVEEATGVPWAFIGALHYRESSNNFKTHLHNGDPLTARTFHVPAGRPADGEPPFTWVASAIDALEYEHFNGKTDWTLENICDRGERYNGLGYRNMGKPSPYLWSGTNNYVRGKYVADGQYDPSTIDRQAGIIPVYLRTMELAHESLIRENSRKLNIIYWVRKGVQALIATIGGLWGTDTVSLISQGAAISLTLVVAAVLVWILINWLDKLMMEDAKAGTWVPSGLADAPSSPNTIDPTPNSPKAEEATNVVAIVPPVVASQ